MSDLHDIIDAKDRHIRDLRRERDDLSVRLEEAEAKIEAMWPRLLFYAGNGTESFDDGEAMNQEEYADQCALVDYAKVRYPSMDKQICCSLGGLRLPIGLAVKAKKMGYQKGWPDLQVASARGGWFGLFIELKRKRNSRTSKDQREVAEALRDAGYRVEIPKGLDAAMRVLDEYMALPVMEVT